MSFVPFIPPKRSASARTEELARRIKEVIEGFRREHPDLGRREIREAVRMALVGAGAGPQAAAVLLGATLAVIGGLLLYIFSFEGDKEGRLPVIVIGILVAFIALVTVKLRNRT
jgi:hypothetical protein